MEHCGVLASQSENYRIIVGPTLVKTVWDWFEEIVSASEL